jgi:hypothetical protein
LAAAIVGGALVMAFFILSRDEAPATEGVAANAPEPLAAAAAAVKADPAPVAEPVPAPEQPDDASSVAACRAAIAGGRYAEAMAHAAQALKLRPGGQAATACEQQAGALHEQEHTFVRGKAALEGGDAEAAHAELARLPADSDFVARPEVADAAVRVGRGRIAEARKLLKRDPAQARALAKSVLELPAQPAGVVAAATRIVAQADQATQSVARAPKPRSSRPARSSPGETPMETASACLSRGDNACVVRALNGKAKTAQELGLLIETYRAMGNSDAAYKNMAVYVRRFPTARRTSAYEKMLERKE